MESTIYPPTYTSTQLPSSSVNNGNSTNESNKIVKGYAFVKQWGSDTADVQLNGPDGIAVDSSGYVYVADSSSHIQKFDSNGKLNISLDYTSSEHNESKGIAVDSSGNVYIADSVIQKFDSSGHYIKWGANDITFANRGIAVDSSGNVFVVDTYDSNVQKFDNNGRLILTWGEFGQFDGQFYNPSGIAVDQSGNVFVKDIVNNRVQKFDNNGTFITKWDTASSNMGQNSIVVDSSGNVFVVDDSHNFVQKFDNNGRLILTWGEFGEAHGQFNEPQGIAVDQSGNVYVADTGNNRIQVFLPLY